jgi:hypothetical protein
MSNKYFNLELTFDEITALMSALQSVDVRNEKLIQRHQNVSLPALYNKLVSAANDIYVTPVELAQ